MKVKTISSFTYWVNPENNELITPEEYIGLNEEERKKLKVSIKNTWTYITFAYCPTCNKWHTDSEIPTYESDILRFSRDCKELKLLMSIHDVDPAFVKDYIQNSDKYDKEEIVKHLKEIIGYHLRKATKEKSETFREIELVRLFEKLSYFYNLFEYEEINKLVEYAVIKYLMLNLKE